MTLLRSGIALLILACGCATEAQGESPAPSQGKSVALSTDSTADEVLDALDALGEGLQDFTADVAMAIEDAGTGLGSTRSGKVAYQNQGNGDSRLRVTFETKEEDDFIRKEKIEYMLDDGWLVDRDYQKKIEVKRQVLRPDEKINLLKLGEGPFPLPIGQDKADVHALFDVTKLDPKNDDPEKTVHLQLPPKPGSQFERKFSTIDVWVDLASHMPRRIETVDRAGVEVRRTDLRNVRVNQGLDDGDFALPAISEKEWTQHSEPYKE